MGGADVTLMLIYRKVETDKLSTTLTHFPTLHEIQIHIFMLHINFG